MRTAPTGKRERDVGHHQRGAGAVHREDVVGDHVVDRHRDRDQLGLTPPALGEERAQRAVDHASGERALLAGATLALEEAAGDLARGVHALLDIHRQREEVDVAKVACGGGARGPLRLAGLDDHGAARLLGVLSGLEGDLGAADLNGDAGYIRLHMFLSAPPPVGGYIYDFSIGVAPERSNGLPCRAGRRAPRAARRAECPDAGRPATNSVGVVVIPARIPAAEVGVHPLGRPAPTAGRPRTCRDPCPAPRSAPRGAGRRGGPGRRRASRASPRSAPAAPPPRPRGPAHARAGAWRRPGSGGTPAGSAGRASSRSTLAQCGHSRSAYSITSTPSPRTWSSLPDGRWYQREPEVAV